MDEDEEEDDKIFQYGRTQRLHWNMRYQNTRASEQKVPQFGAEKQKVKSHATS